MPKPAHFTQSVSEADMQWGNVTPLSRANPGDSQGNPQQTTAHRLQQSVIKQASKILECLSYNNLPNAKVCILTGGIVQLEFRIENRELQITIGHGGSTT